MQAYISAETIRTCGSGQPGCCDEVKPDDVQAACESMVDDATAKTLAGIFRALGDPTRVRIVSALAERELCVSDLTVALGMAQPAVSHQLRDMHALHLVRSRREGRHVYYRLDDEHVSDLFGRALAHVHHSAVGHNEQVDHPDAG